MKSEKHYKQVKNMNPKTFETKFEHKTDDEEQGKKDLLYRYTNLNCLMTTSFDENCELTVIYNGI